ncbi:hypothetical protein DRB07_11730 [Actinomyces sp. Z3]|nr:hypothetical protein DRB07_11730 [Actinomyces sp. Z3]
MVYQGRFIAQKQSRSGSPPVGLVPQSRLALAALVLATVAATATLLCSVLVGLNLGPLQARAAVGEELPGDATMETVYLALLLSNLLWTVIGVAGLGVGITAVARGQDRSRGIAAIIVSVVAPVVSFGVWLVLTLITAPLG